MAIWKTSKKQVVKTQRVLEGKRVFKNITRQRRRQREKHRKHWDSIRKTKLIDNKASDGKTVVGQKLITLALPPDRGTHWDLPWVISIFREKAGGGMGGGGSGSKWGVCFGVGGGRSLSNTIFFCKTKKKEGVKRK